MSSARSRCVTRRRRAASRSAEANARAKSASAASARASAVARRASGARRVSAGAGDGGEGGGGGENARGAAGGSRFAGDGGAGDGGAAGGDHTRAAGGSVAGLARWGAPSNGTGAVVAPNAPKASSPRLAAGATFGRSRASVGGGGGVANGADADAMGGGADAPANGSGSESGGPNGLPLTWLHVAIAAEARVQVARGCHDFNVVTFKLVKGVDQQLAVDPRVVQNDEARAGRGRPPSGVPSRSPTRRRPRRRPRGWTRRSRPHPRSSRTRAPSLADAFELPRPAIKFEPAPLSDAPESDLPPAIQDPVAPEHDVPKASPTEDEHAPAPAAQASAAPAPAGPVAPVTADGPSRDPDPPPSVSAPAPAAARQPYPRDPHARWRAIQTDKDPFTRVMLDHLRRAESTEPYHQVGDKWRREPWEPNPYESIGPDSSSRGTCPSPTRTSSSPNSTQT